MKFSTRTIITAIVSGIVVLGIAFGVAYFLKQSSSDNTTNSEQTPAQLASQANSTAMKASDASQKGDYTQATELYTQAKDLYKQAGDTAQANNIDAQLSLVKHQKNHTKTEQSPPSLAPGGN